MAMPPCNRCRDRSRPPRPAWWFIEKDMQRPSATLPATRLDPSPQRKATRALDRAGRVWRPELDGPSVVAIRASGVFDVLRAFPTMRDLCEAEKPAAALAAA